MKRNYLIIWFVLLSLHFFVSGYASETVFLKAQQCDAFIIGKVVSGDNTHFRVEVDQLVKDVTSNLKTGKIIRIAQERFRGPEHFIREQKSVAIGLNRQKDGWEMDQFISGGYPDSVEFHSPFAQVSISVNQFAADLRVGLDIFNINQDGKIATKVSDHQLLKAINEHPYLRFLYHHWDIQNKFVRPPDFGFWIDYQAKVNQYITFEAKQNDGQLVHASFPNQIRPISPSFFLHFVKRAPDSTITEEYVNYYNLLADSLREIFHYWPEISRTSPSTLKLVTFKFSVNSYPTSHYNNYRDYIYPFFGGGHAESFIKVHDKNSQGKFSCTNIYKDTVIGYQLNGMLDGPFAIKRENTIQTGNYRQDKVHGEWKHFIRHLDRTSLEVTYKNGILHGPFVRYTTNQDETFRLHDGAYKEGVQIGIWREYHYNNGRLKSRIEYKPVPPKDLYRSFGEQTPYHKALSQYANKPDTYAPLGTCEFFFDNGSPKSIQHWDDDIILSREDWFIADSVKHHIKGTYANNAPYSGTFLVGAANDELRLGSAAGGRTWHPAYKVSIDTYKAGTKVKSKVIIDKPESGRNVYYIVVPEQSYITLFFNTVC